MSEIENKSQEQISRRRFLEFTGKSMVVTGLGVILALSSKPFVSSAQACCSCESDCGCDYYTCVDNDPGTPCLCGESSGY